MALSDYLLPINSGKQMWQVLQANITRGDHQWNFVGICQALASQWFVELKFANGRSPEELGRYLLQADLGKAGYNSIVKVQSNNLTLDTQSAGTVKGHSGILSEIPVHDGNMLGLILLSKLRNIDDRGVDDLDGFVGLIKASRGGATTPISFQLSVIGPNGWLISKIFGDVWGHAIGIYCDGNRLYVFDPNAGVYIIDPSLDASVSGFCNDLWASYAPAAGRLQPITGL